MNNVIDNSLSNLSKFLAGERVVSAPCGGAQLLPCTQHGARGAFPTGKDRLCGEVDTNIGSAHWHVSKLQTVGWKTGFWHQLPNITFLKPEKVGFWYHKMGGHWPRNTADTLWNVWGRQVHCPELRGVERLPVAASFFDVGATCGYGSKWKKQPPAWWVWDVLSSWSTLW